MKPTIRLANESFIGLHQGAVVVELMKLVLEHMEVSAEREVSLHKNVIVNASDRLAMVNGRRRLQDL